MWFSHTAILRPNFDIFSEPQISHILQDKLELLLSEIIRRQTEAVRPKVDKLAALAPLRPVDQRRRPTLP